MLEQANNGKVVGECQMCKLSRVAQEQLAHEVAAAAAAEGTNNIVTNTAGNGVHESMRMDCCMRKMLASQQDFICK